MHGLKKLASLQVVKKLFLTRAFGSPRKQMSQSEYNYSLIFLYNLKANLILLNHAKKERESSKAFT